MSQYAIGLTADNLIELSSVGIPDPFPVEFSPYTKIAGTNGSGHALEVGPPTLVWNFKRLKGEWWNFFYNTIGGGRPSTEVYLRTSTRDAANFPFGTFRAVMWRPTCSQVDPGKLYSNVKIQFKYLEKVG